MAYEAHEMKRRKYGWRKLRRRGCDYFNDRKYNLGVRNALGPLAAPPTTKQQRPQLTLDFLKINGERKLWRK